MSGETMELIETLKLNEATTDEKLSSARDFALRCLRSKAPIPQTVMTVVERGASHSDATSPLTDNNTTASAITAGVTDTDATVSAIDNNSMKG